MTYTNSSGIVYHATMTAIRIARIRRAFRLRIAAFRSTLSSLYAALSSPLV